MTVAILLQSMVALAGIWVRARLSGIGLGLSDAVGLVIILALSLSA